MFVIPLSLGSGKSSQLPQMLLDSPYHTTAKRPPQKGRGRRTRQRGRNRGHNSSGVRGEREPFIVVTQPRRMAAVTLAKRVAAERKEGVGKTVGYLIGSDRECGRSVCVIFECLKLIILPWEILDILFIYVYVSVYILCILGQHRLEVFAIIYV